PLQDRRLPSARRAHQINDVGPGPIERLTVGLRQGIVGAQHALRDLRLSNCALHCPPPPPAQGMPRPTLLLPRSAGQTHRTPGTARGTPADGSAPRIDGMLRRRGPPLSPAWPPRPVSPLRPPRS